MGEWQGPSDPRARNPPAWPVVASEPVTGNSSPAHGPLACQPYPLLSPRHVPVSGPGGSRVTLSLFLSLPIATQLSLGLRGRSGGQAAGPAFPLLQHHPHPLLSFLSLISML